MHSREQRRGYKPVPNDESSDDTGRLALKPSIWKRMSNCFSGHLTPIFVFGFGIAIGALAATEFLSPKTCVSGTLQQPPSERSPMLDIPIAALEMPFVYNRTFGEDPRENKATLAAWDSIMPRGLGSVRFPQNSSNVYTLSVFHQLHCLWSIHSLFYERGPHTEDARTKDNHARHTDTAHMRHCFDYIRQSLMCASDVSLEPVDAELGGVTGWGNERVCRDYEQVSVWAEAHRVNNLRGFSHHGE